MPEYAEDLVTYLHEVGEQPPTKMLEDPELTRRALSAESPITLVAKVAEAIEDVDTHPAITTLSDYEKGRVLGVLGRVEEAEELYDNVLQTSEDSNLRGRTLMNKAVHYLQTDPEEAKKLLKKALEDENFKEARITLATLYFRMGKAKKAEECLIKGIKKGESLCIPVLTDLFAETVKTEPELAQIFAQVYQLALQSGISQEGIVASYKQHRAMMLMKKDDKVLNMPALFNAHMEAALKDMEFEDALGASGT
jgi:tetratricopeptide (TPR) repeat protein